ncbi:MAG TPA: YqjK family protein [Noviherbaspirillum sp.]|nr:YqjK family protein [Noviherbaspirillum sp.]
MKTRAEFLAWKRRQLLAESGMHRAELVQQLRPWAYRLESVESGLRIAARVRQPPGWIAGAAVAILLVTPRRLSSLIRLGISGLRSWQSIAPMVRGMIERMR